MPPYESKMCLSFTEIWGNSGVNDTIKHSVIRNTTYVKINQQYIQKTDLVQFPLFIGLL